ncbi:MAG: hypothetical protein ACD_3C00104G0004 [uncultured bacterium (gcode 4)]|uniref:Uncharacterized protein n=1 Tax=uncultured bacterium (gcode 4) TaxID=1234023 RepID=K2GCZ2_9BACT|nr:MAG: hypothetical protein ACD_3C00104G0004 [uncultured bacterium (gcode 4)]
MFVYCIVLNDFSKLIWRISDKPRSPKSTISPVDKAKSPPLYPRAWPLGTCPSH